MANGKGSQQGGIIIYRKNGSGMPAVQALRQAQTDMLRNGDTDKLVPYNWAAFVAIGGHTKF